MGEWIGYFYIEDLGLSDTQRATLIDVLKAWGTQNDSIYPNLRNHWAIRPDNKAVIFEAIFDDSKLTAEWMRYKLADIFGIDPSSIDYTIISTVYGPAVTYTYVSVNKLRFGIFGGLSADWNESHACALDYLLDHPEWEGEGLP